MGLFFLTTCQYSGFSFPISALGTFCPGHCSGSALFSCDRSCCASFGLHQKPLLIQSAPSFCPGKEQLQNSLLKMKVKLAFFFLRNSLFFFPNFLYTILSPVLTSGTLCSSSFCHSFSTAYLSFLLSADVSE